VQANSTLCTRGQRLLSSVVLFEASDCVWWQDAGEASVANIDKLRHANGKISPAELRLKMQKVMNITVVLQETDSGSQLNLARR